MTSRKHNAALWGRYYATQQPGAAPNPLLRRSLRYVSRGAPKCAIDVGCGRGNDTLFLLERGYYVHALDAQRNAVALLRRAVPASLKSRLKTKVIRFEHLRRRDLGQVSIVNASYSLFFCPPSAFERLWRNLTAHLELGGVFCGHFLGPRDSWAGKRGMTAHSKRELTKLFDDYEVLELIEREDDSATATGIPKHWHVFCVIARKR